MKLLAKSRVGAGFEPRQGRFTIAALAQGSTLYVLRTPTMLLPSPTPWTASIHPRVNFLMGGGAYFHADLTFPGAFFTIANNLANSRTLARLSPIPPGGTQELDAPIAGFGLSLRVGLASGRGTALGVGGRFRCAFVLGRDGRIAVNIDGTNNRFLPDWWTVGPFGDRQFNDYADHEGPIVAGSTGNDFVYSVARSESRKRLVAALQINDQEHFSSRGWRVIATDPLPSGVIGESLCTYQLSDGQIADGLWGSRSVVVATTTEGRLVRTVLMQARADAGPTSTTFDQKFTPWVDLGNPGGIFKVDSKNDCLSGACVNDMESIYFNAQTPVPRAPSPSLKLGGGNTSRAIRNAIGAQIPSEDGSSPPYPSDTPSLWRVFLSGGRFPVVAEWEAVTTGVRPRDDWSSPIGRLRLGGFPGLIVDPRQQITQQIHIFVLEDVEPVPNMIERSVAYGQTSKIFAGQIALGANAMSWSFLDVP